MNVPPKKSGFTLIEVSFAVLIVGLGLLTVFSLFPSGLRMAEVDLADTKCALFSQRVFSGMHANALAMTNAATWTNDTFLVAIAANVLGNNSDVVTTDTTNSFAPNADDGVRYALTISNAAPFKARLLVWYGLYGTLTNTVPTVNAYTEFYEFYQAK